MANDSKTGAPGSSEKIGLDDDALATSPTIYAPDAFAGHVVVVSGGAGGIGRATAWLLGRLGARVVIAGRKRDRLDALVSALAEREIAASGIVVDIRRPESVDALFDEVWETHGRLDLLINSAGGQFPQAAIDFSEKARNAGHRHQSQWHLVHDAGGRTPLARQQTAGLDRQYCRGDTPRPLWRRPHRCRARRCHRSEPESRRRVGAGSTSASTVSRPAPSKPRAGRSIRRKRGHNITGPIR